MSSRLLSSVSLGFSWDLGLAAIKQGGGGRCPEGLLTPTYPKVGRGGSETMGGGRWPSRYNIPGWLRN